MKTAFLGFCLLLTACGGSDELTCETAYWDGTIGTCVPDGWQVVTRDQLEERGIPEQDAVIAFQSDTPVSGQFATVVVTRETISDDMTSEEYSEASVQSVTRLPGYSQIDEQVITVNEEDVAVHIFSAQPRDDQPESRFYQVSAVSKGTGYTFTAATPVSVPKDLENEVLLMLRGITFTDPSAGQ